MEFLRNRTETEIWIFYRNGTEIFWSGYEGQVIILCIDMVDYVDWNAHSGFGKNSSEKFCVFIYSRVDQILTRCLCKKQNYPNNRRYGRDRGRPN